MGRLRGVEIVRHRTGRISSPEGVSPEPKFVPVNNRVGVICIIGTTKVYQIAVFARRFKLVARMFIALLTKNSVFLVSLFLLGPLFF